MLADWFGDLPKELRASPKDSGFEYLVYVSSMSLHQRTRDLKDASLNKLEDLVQKLDSARADLKSKLGRASGSAEEEYDACAKAFTEFDESMRKLGRAVLDAAKGGKDEASDVARVALLVTEASRAFFDATVGDAPSRQGRQIAAADTDKCKEIVKGCLGELAKDKDGDRDRDLLER